MTKEEILRSFVEKDDFNNYMDEFRFDGEVKTVYSAMDKWHEQESKPLIEENEHLKEQIKINKQLIEFLKLTQQP